MDWNEHSVVYCPRKEGLLRKKGKWWERKRGWGEKRKIV